MSLFDNFIPTYTFRLQIERDDCTILDTAIATKANAGEFEKVKKTIQKLLDEYTPTTQPSRPTTAPEPPPAPTEPEGQEGPAQAQETAQQPEGPAEAAAPPERRPDP